MAKYAKELAEWMLRVEELHPLTLEHGEDARYVWPARWQALKKLVSRDCGRCAEPPNATT